MALLRLVAEGVASESLGKVTQSLDYRLSDRHGSDKELVEWTCDVMDGGKISNAEMKGLLIAKILSADLRGEGRRETNRISESNRRRLARVALQVYPGDSEIESVVVGECLKIGPSNDLSSAWVEIIARYGSDEAIEEVRKVGEMGGNAPEFYRLVRSKKGIRRVQASEGIVNKGWKERIDWILLFLLCSVIGVAAFCLKRGARWQRVQ